MREDFVLGKGRARASVGGEEGLFFFGLLVIHLFKVLLDQVEERKKEEGRRKKEEGRRKKRKRKERKIRRSKGLRDLSRKVRDFQSCWVFLYILSCLVCFVCWVLQMRKKLM